jgi:hypothetical protein
VFFIGGGRVLVVLDLGQVDDWWHVPTARGPSAPPKPVAPLPDHDAAGARSPSLRPEPGVS